tara:strand:- start:5418 stop:8735 length:3318 start_codon:yes stop_codon:yes gene_type:complete
MSELIGFNKLFDAGSFDAGTSKIAEYIRKITDEIKQAETAANGLAKAMGKQLQTDINALSSSSKKLAADMQTMAQKMNDFKTTTSNTKKVISDYEKENEILRKELIKLKLAQEGVGKAAKATGTSFKGASQAILGVASGAALLYSGIRVLKEQLVLAVKSAMEFEQAMKEVQAISRATENQFKLLTENANRLGATTEKTAGQIAKLQKELAKLGFNTTEILASTDAIVDLSTATGEDLAQSATVAAATLRAFGLEAVEMGRVVDVMAGSFVRSGLDLDKFRESMKLVAPIARATNIDVETTTAALSKLADAGLSGSLAGTALRNLFSEMADPTSKLVKYLGGLNAEFADGVNSSDEMIRAFKALRDSGVDLAKAVQMVDVRARPAFFTLMNQVDAVEGLSLEYKILDGEANGLAATMRDTLTNDVEIAKSAFDAMRRNIVEQFIPAMRESVSNITEMSEFIRFLTNDIVTLDTQTGLLGLTFKFLGDLLGELSSAFGLDMWGRAMDEIKKFNDFRRAAEAINATTLSLESLSSELKELPNIVGNLGTLEKIFKDGTYEGVHLMKDSVKELGKEYELLFKKLEQGVITEVQAATALKSMLSRTAQSLSSSITQQENKVVLLKKEYDLNIRTNGQREQGEEHYDAQYALLKQMSLINTFLEGSYKEQADLNALLTKLKGKQGKYVEGEAEDEKAKTKELQEQLKLQSQLNQLKLKGELDVIEQLKKTEDTNPFSKLEIDKLVKDKKIEIAQDKLNEELKLIDTLYKNDVNYLLKRKVAYEKFVNEVRLINYDYIDESNKMLDESVEITTKNFEDVLKNSWKGLDDLAKKHAEDKEKQNKGAETEEEAHWNKIAKITDMAAQGISKITTAIFDGRQIQRANELAAIQSWEQEKIRLAGDNEDAILVIKEESERRQKAIRIQQAKDNKKEAIFQIVIDTAQAIMSAVAASPLTGGLPFSAIAGALGALQIATVMAQPLPQFAKGTSDSQEGYAEVGERGRELIKDGKTGRWSLTPDSSTVTYLTKHSQVITNAETERILSQDHNNKADNYLSSNVKQARSQQIDYSKIGQEVGKHISNIPVNVTNFDQNGVTKYVMGRSSKITRLNKKY